MKIVEYNLTWWRARLDVHLSNEELNNIKRVELTVRGLSMDNLQLMIGQCLPLIIYIIDQWHGKQTGTTCCSNVPSGLLLIIPYLL